jgi:hypothetical protein
MAVMWKIALLAVIGLLASPAWANGDDTCGAAGFRGLVGQSGQIARMLELDQPVRVIPPGTAVTMDFRPERINFELDEDGRIAVVRCG